MVPLRSILPFLAVLLLPAASVAGGQQSALVDEGTFTITQRGAPIGREAFRIVRATGQGGQAFRASGTTVIGDQRLIPILAADSAGSPVSYTSEIVVKGALMQRLQGTGRPGRFLLATTLRDGAESAREYVVSNGLLVLDENVFHHFYFVPMIATHTRAAVIVPKTGVQEQCTIMGHGSEPVEIAGVKVPGRRYSITGASGGRDVWVDARGRLLKVAIPGSGLVALRDDPPR